MAPVSADGALRSILARKVTVHQKDEADEAGVLAHGFKLAAGAAKKMTIVY